MTDWLRGTRVYIWRLLPIDLAAERRLGSFNSSDDGCAALLSGTGQSNQNISQVSAKKKSSYPLKPEKRNRGERAWDMLYPLHRNSQKTLLCKSDWSSIWWNAISDMREGCEDRKWQKVDCFEYTAEERRRGRFLLYHGSMLTLT